jgi:hypothetical protein
MASGDISESTAQIYGLVRELLEARNEKSKYPTLVMYCDWSLHSKLNRSRAGNALLDLLDSTWANSKNVDAQFKELCQAVSPYRLQHELIECLTTCLLNATLFEDRLKFLKFMTYLTADLLRKPIVRPENEIKNRMDERLAKGYRFMADRLLFDRSDDNQNQIMFVAKQIAPSIGGEVRVVIPWPIPGLADEA